MKDKPEDNKKLRQTYRYTRRQRDKEIQRDTETAEGRDTHEDIERHTKRDNDTYRHIYRIMSVHTTIVANACCAWCMYVHITGGAVDQWDWSWTHSIHSYVYARRYKYTHG